MKKFIKLTLVAAIQKLLNGKNTCSIINYIFESGNWKVKDFFMRNIQPPSNELDWYFYLLNKKKIVVPVKKSFPNSWQFATSYFWHDPGLAYAEYCILSFYDNQYAYFDIGANTGLRSLLATSTNRKTILFEPNIKLHSFINELFNKNKLSNYTIEPLCLSDHEGKQTFFISSSSYMSSLIKGHASEDKIIDEFEVQLITLNHYVAKKKLIPKIIKIDVEGHELAVLKGATEVIAAHEPSFIIEILNEPVNKKEIFDFFITMGYTIIAISAFDKPYLTKNFLPEKHYSFNYLFVKNTELLAHLKGKNLMIDLRE